MLNFETKIFDGFYHHYEYLIERNNLLGNINGYILITPQQNGFKLSEKELNFLKCHGGITFDKVNRFGNRLIGFDTWHSDDYPRNKNGHRWTIHEVKSQCKKLIRQLQQIPRFIHSKLYKIKSNKSFVVFQEKLFSSLSFVNAFRCKYYVRVINLHQQTYLEVIKFPSKLKKVLINNSLVKLSNQDKIKVLSNSESKLSRIICNTSLDKLAEKLK